MNRDNEIFDVIRRERERQTKGIELIASENFVSDQVMEATPLLWWLRGSGYRGEYRP